MLDDGAAPTPVPLPVELALVEFVVFEEGLLVVLVRLLLLRVNEEEEVEEVEKEDVVVPNRLSLATTA